MLKRESDTFTPHQMALLKRFTEPLPFEAELLSGDMQRVEDAIVAIGRGRE